MSDQVAILIGTLTGVLGTLLVQRYVIRQKAHELFLTSLEHLGGGSQERNLGISAIEFYWKDYKNEAKLIVPLLVGAAIYLLNESKQGDSAHERYNLKRIMSLLLKKYELDTSASIDSPMMECFCDLHKALSEWDPNPRIITEKGKTVTRGLCIEKELVDKWKNNLECKIPSLNTKCANDLK